LPHSASSGSGLGASSVAAADDALPEALGVVTAALVALGAALAAEAATVVAALGAAVLVGFADVELGAESPPDEQERRRNGTATEAMALRMASGIYPTMRSPWV
jgi:hypothetical protein